jgi:membrane-bound lytic murein transglycosylase MltF
VLYVNNIRSYYNILKWLTAGEDIEAIEEELMKEQHPEELEPETREEPATETA